MLKLDRLNDIDMLEPMRLNQVRIIYQGEDGIIFHELRSDICMISMNNVHNFKMLYEQKELHQYQLFNVKQKEIADVLVNDYHQTLQFACYQAVYEHSKHIPIEYPLEVNICLLTSQYSQKIKEVYQHSDDSQYIDELIAKKHLWGLLENNELAGFIGIHNEGSMGLLEVLPQYQRRGYAMMLESYLINYFLDHSWIPYCQVIEDNYASLQLQKKLGLEISSRLSYWLFEN